MQHKKSSGREALDTQLNIRLASPERQLFQEFCREHNATQRDGLLALLSQEAASKTVMTQRLQRQSQKIAEQKRKLEEQPDTNQSGSRSDKANKKLLDAIRFFGVGVYEYAKHVTRDQKVPMKCCSWRAFKESFADWKAYRSPDEECFIPFRLECLCYGKGRMPAVFIFGRRMGTEERIRLRFYERREYVGPHPTKSGMFYEGSCFLLGGKPGADGACDLLFAIPFPSDRADCPTENENGTDKSINDVLTDAYGRNR